MTTRRRKPEPTSEIVDEDREPVDYANNDMVSDEPFSKRPRFNLAGCMQPLMFVMIIAMMGFLIWDRSRPVTVVPAVPVVVPVINNLAAYTDPIRLKLATDKAKAAIVADTYAGMRDALAGPSGARVTDSRIFETFSRATLSDLDTKGGIAVGAEIDTAIGSYLGMTKSSDPKEPGWTPMQFDAATRAKLVEIVGAIATTAEAIR
jgi:hypothetical protein